MVGIQGVVLLSVKCVMSCKASKCFRGVPAIDVLATGPPTTDKCRMKDFNDVDYSTIIPVKRVTVVTTCDTNQWRL